MKTIGILLIGLGTVLGFYLSKTSPETSTDSTYLLIFGGIVLLTTGLAHDKLT